MNNSEPTTYATWITNNVTETYGRCAEVTLQMQEAFPELTRVRGEYLCWIWGPRDHWWLMTTAGQVVDPTADQFPSKGGGEYQALPDDAPEPRGMCANCGDVYYGDMDTVCSEACHRAYVAYCTRGF